MMQDGFGPRFSKVPSGAGRNLRQGRAAKTLRVEKEGDFFRFNGLTFLRMARTRILICGVGFIRQRGV